MQKGRLSLFALYVRKFLGLNSQFLKVTVLTLGSQYPQIASLVVRSKWSVSTPGNSCSDPYSKMLERRNVIYRQLLHWLWSPLFYSATLQPIFTTLTIHSVVLGTNAQP